MNHRKCLAVFILCAIAQTFIESTALGQKSRLVFFRNNLTAPLLFSVRSPQNPAGTRPTLIQPGREAAFTFSTDGKFELIGRTEDDKVVFARKEVDLQTLVTGLRGNRIPVTGIFDDELAFDSRGGTVKARRVGLLYTFPLKCDERPFTVLATSETDSFESWRCRSMSRPARPSIYATEQADER